MNVIKTLEDTVGFWGGALDPTTGRFLAGTTDGRILAYAIPELGEPAAVFQGHHGYVTGVLAVAPRKQIVSCGFDRQLICRDAESGEVSWQRELQSRPLGMAISADDELLAVVDDDRVLTIINFDDGETLRRADDEHPRWTLAHRTSVTYCVAFSPDCRLVVTGCRAGYVVIRELLTLKVVRRVDATSFYSISTSNSQYEWGGVRMLTFTPDGATLVAGGMGPSNQNSAGLQGQMRLQGIDLATGESKFEVLLPKQKTNGEGLVNVAVFHPDGHLVVGGGGGTQSVGDGALYAVDLSTPDYPVSHYTPVVIRACAITPDGNHLITAGMLKNASVGRIDVWSLTADE